MWDDPIVEEIRKVRNAHAKKFNYDLKAIAADLRKQQQDGAHEPILLPPKKPTILPKAKAENKK